MQNGGVGKADKIEIIAVGDTFTLHFTLCTLHSLVQLYSGQVVFRTFLLCIPGFFGILL